MGVTLAMQLFLSSHSVCRRRVFLVTNPAQINSETLVFLFVFL